MGILEEILAGQKEILSALEALGAPAGSTSAPSGETAAEKKKREAAEAKAKKAAKPDFNAEQLRDKFLEVQKKHGDAAAKALITENGHAKLADLIGDTDGWQKAWDSAVAKLEEEPEGDDNGGL
jgi:hypothetical protein